MQQCGHQLHPHGPRDDDRQAGHQGWFITLHVPPTTLLTVIVRTASGRTCCPTRNTAHHVGVSSVADAWTCVGY